MRRSAIVVEGPLAFSMRRLAAARADESGAAIMTLPQMAARLAGGFARPVGAHELDPAIRAALEAGGLPALERIRTLPGTTRAVARTLRRVWDAGITLPDHGGHPRLRDLATIEARVRANLPAAVLSPPDLHDAAMRRLAHAASVVGSVELDGVVDVAPIWRGLLCSLTQAGVAVTWIDPGTSDRSWFTGEVVVTRRPAGPAPEVITCANPRAEVVEALRWTRDLIISGRARPGEIAICAASPRDWDGHMAALAADAGLPVHFSHGLPALDSSEGQACAALADVLNSGIVQKRVRRLIDSVMGRCAILADLPRSWGRGVDTNATLTTVDHWCQALAQAAERRGDGVDIRPTLLPVLQMLARGVDAAKEAGQALLSHDACALWDDALRRGPAAALTFSLRELRRPDRRDPGSCAAWCPADHLAAAPRRFVRLLGMTARGWPRRADEDPLLDQDLLTDCLTEADSLAERDRRAFCIITERADGGCVLSRSRRNATGGIQAPSPLIPKGTHETALRRARIPGHAFSESDRLLARPGEASSTPAVADATACWRAWRSNDVTAYDGRVRDGHPLVAAAIERVQSATSLALLLQDPLGFVWRYALGWRSPDLETQPLVLGPKEYGELVHEILRRAVDGLEPDPGLCRASLAEVEAALDAAAGHVAAAWPLRRAVPPSLLWRHTVEAARALSLAALRFDKAFEASTRSFTEIAFGLGGEQARGTAGLPWPPTASVTVPGTGVLVRGAIDRLDVNGAGDARVTDYKTAAEPRGADRIVLGRGAELQRVLYALAVRDLLPRVRRIRSRLVFLGGESPAQHALADVDGAINAFAGQLRVAVDSLRGGNALPGLEARGVNDLRLALPAAGETYFRTKGAAFARALGQLRIGRAT